MNATMIMLTRRQAIKVAAITGTAVVTAAVFPAAPAAAAGSKGVPSAATALTALPRLYGTPTDLARTSSRTTWAREPDGSVLKFERNEDVWVPRPDRLWADLLTAGAPHLARWGGPSSHELVIVLTDPSTDPPLPPPSTPSQPTSGGSASPSAPWMPRPSDKPQLANTGAPLLPLGAGAALAVAAGAVLAFRNRKSLHPNNSPEAGEPEEVT